MQYSVGDRVAYVERVGYGERLYPGTVVRVMPHGPNGQLQDELELVLDTPIRESSGFYRKLIGGPVGYFRKIEG